MTLTVAILDPSNVHNSDIGKAYYLWLSVWQKTFKELGESPLISSDDFSRQDEIVALFDPSNGACAALSFGRIVDLSSPIARNDSYFSSWLWSDMDLLHNDVCYISSYFTVAPEYRKTEAKHDLMRALIRQFEWSRADVLCGTTRNDRGVNKLVAQHGFETIRTDAVMHGVYVDLVCYRGKTK